MQMCIEHAPECSNNNCKFIFGARKFRFVKFLTVGIFFIYWLVSQNEAINKIGFDLTCTKLSNQILKNWSLAFF